MGNFKQELSAFNIPGHCTQRHIEENFLAVCACHERTAAILAVARNDMFAKLQVKECPELGIAAQNNITSAAAIAAVWSAARIHLGTVKMPAARAALSAAATNLHIVNKIGFRHGRKDNPALRRLLLLSPDSYFSQLLVCTIIVYICSVKIEDEIKTRGFRNEYHKLHVNVIFSAWWLKTRLSASLKTFGLTPEQFNVLRIVRGQKEMLCVKDITSRMLERNSNTTRIIDKLQAKGLVERHASSNDRREIRIHLTEKGSALLSEIDAHWDRQDPVSLPLSEPEAKTLNNLLDRMRG